MADDRKGGKLPGLFAVTRPALAGGVFRAVLAGVLGVVAFGVFRDAGWLHWIGIGYTVWAISLLHLIRRNAWREMRVPLGGLVDYVVVTGVVHELGSVRTVMVLFYFVAGTLYAFAAPFRTALFLGAVGSFMYSGVVLVERLGFLPFAPLSPDIAAIGQPPAGITAFGVLLGAALHFGLVAVVAMLVREVQAHRDELAVANRRLQELSEHDPLTGLHNRRFLFVQLEREMARAQRGVAVSLLMMDLDHFKIVNDSQGHVRGDELLRGIARELGKAVRVTDFAARYGGDEIVALLPDTGREEAAVVGERLLEAVRRASRGFDPAHPVTASVGHALARRDDTATSFLARADNNTYAAKRRGGDALEMDAERRLAEAPLADAG